LVGGVRCGAGAAVVHAWAAWCGPCREEIPSLDDLIEAMAEKGRVGFVFLSGIKESFSRSKNFLSRYDLDAYAYNAADGNDEFVDVNGAEYDRVDYYPTVPGTYVINQNGVIIFKKLRSFYRWTEFERTFEVAAQ